MIPIPYATQRFVINEMLLGGRPAVPSYTAEQDVTVIHGVTYSSARCNAITVNSGPYQFRTVSDAHLFHQLATQWRSERGATSSLTQMMLCSAYQRIIGMGDRAVPLILAELEREAGDPDHWGWALHAITGDDPIPEEAAGDTVQIARAWLDWGRARYAW